MSILPRPPPVQADTRARPLGRAPRLRRPGGRPDLRRPRPPPSSRGSWKVVRAAERLDSTSRYHDPGPASRRTTGRSRPACCRGASTRWPSWSSTPTAERPAARSWSRPPPPPPSPTGPRPLVVAMVISIDGTHYAVAPLAPAPGASKAFRFAKVGGDERSTTSTRRPTGARATAPTSSSAARAWTRWAASTSGRRRIGADRRRPSPRPTPATAYDDAGRSWPVWPRPRRWSGARARPARRVRRACCCDPADEPAPCTGCLAHHEGEPVTWPTADGWTAGGGSSAPTSRPTTRGPTRSTCGRGTRPRRRGRRRENDPQR